MPKNSIVRARADGHIKDEAASVLAEIGLTPSDASRILLTRTAKEKALLFEPLVPNKKTIAAMKAARRGDLVAVYGIQNLLRNLNDADD